MITVLQLVLQLVIYSDAETRKTVVLVVADMTGCQLVPRTAHLCPEGRVIDTRLRIPFQNLLEETKHSLTRLPLRVA